jgi:hypothetical protein
MGRKHSMDEVLRDLRKKKDVLVRGNSIEVLNGFKTKREFDLGNKTWGKIDFLTNHCGYKVFHVSEFSKEGYSGSNTFMDAMVDMLQSRNRRSN